MDDEGNEACIKVDSLEIIETQSTNSSSTARAAPAQGRRSCGPGQCGEKCVSAQFDPCSHFRDPPIPGSSILIPKNRVGPNCNFFRLRTVALPSILKYRRKSAGNQSCDQTRFRFTGTKKSPQSKKSCKNIRIFVFCNGQTTETKQIRENYPTNAEWRLNAKPKGAAIQRLSAKLRGAAIHLGPAHPGRLPPSTRRENFMANGLKLKATRGKPRWPVL